MARPGGRYCRKYNAGKGLRQKGYRQPRAMTIYYTGMRCKVLAGKGLWKNSNRIIKLVGIFVSANLAFLLTLLIVSEN